MVSNTAVTRNKRENKKYFKDLSEFLSKNKTYMTDKEFANVKQNLTII